MGWGIGLARREDTVSMPRVASPGRLRCRLSRKRPYQAVLRPGGVYCLHIRSASPSDIVRHHRRATGAHPPTDRRRDPAGVRPGQQAGAAIPRVTTCSACLGMRRSKVSRQLLRRRRRGIRVDGASKVPCHSVLAGRSRIAPTFFACSAPPTPFASPAHPVGKGRRRDLVGIRRHQRAGGRRNACSGDGSCQGTRALARTRSPAPGHPMSRYASCCSAFRRAR
jgi:hypothetical protein